MASFSNVQEMLIRRIDPALVEGQSDDDFLAVAANVSRLKHPNIVRMLGYCVDQGERMLVFDHYPNGSLYDHLHDPSRQLLMSWDARVEMAIGIGAALE